MRQQLVLDQQQEQEAETPEQRVAVLEAEAKQIEVVDDATRQAADLAIGKLKTAAAELEQEKEVETRPLLVELEAKRAPYLKAIKLLTEIRKALEQRVGAYITEQRRIEQERQRKAIEDAERVKAEAEAKAKAARDAAAAAAAKGDTVTATKLEQKAEKLDLKAATTVAAPVATTSRSTDLGGTVLTTNDKPDWELVGRDKTVKIHADDPLFAQLDWFKYRRFFVLDVTRVNKAVQAGEKLGFPFRMTVKYGSTQRKTS